MYRFDFRKTVAQLRDLTAYAHGAWVDAGHERGEWYGALREACGSAERELAVAAVEYLYDLMVRRDQFTGAAHLVAWATPVGIRGDDRIRALVQHAVSAAASASPESELLNARACVDAAPDEIAQRAAIDSRGLYWLTVVRLTRARTALELGCGSGLNTLQCARSEVSTAWTGADPNPAQVESCSNQARRLGIDAKFLAASETPRRAYESVGLLHVLEHTAYPIEMLQWAEGFVAPGGILTVVLPADAWHFGYPVADGALSPHVNVASLADTYALCKTRGRVLDVREIPSPHGAVNACVAYEPAGAP